MSREKIVIIKEHTAWSVVADTFTFTSICAAFWFNYTFIDGNNWLDVLLFISFFLFAVGKAGQLKKYNQLLEDENGPNTTKQKSKHD